MDPENLTLEQKLDLLAASQEMLQTILVALCVLELDRTGQGPKISAKAKVGLLKTLAGFAQTVILSDLDEAAAAIHRPGKN